MFTQGGTQKKLQSLLTGVIYSDCKMIKNNLRINSYNLLKKQQ